ncbi:hypothetical protein [Methylobacterium sp. J-030]|nr:hypothetical protein [Methylobacterium sp. J-030]
MLLDELPVPLPIEPDVPVEPVLIDPELPAPMRSPVPLPLFI